MSRHPVTKALLELCEPVVADCGYELVDIEYRREQSGWVVRVFIDRSAWRSGWRSDGRNDRSASEPGAAVVPIGSAAHPSPIGFNDCEVVSRELSAVLDVADPIPTAYNLEVSSPGLDRPLRTVEHFRAELGQQAKIVLAHGIGGRRNFKGELLAADAETVVIRVDGSEFQLPVGDIDSARLVPDWDQVLARRSDPG